MGADPENNISNNSGEIRWYSETMQFDTMRETHEWVYSGAYNEIGTLYDGYITQDLKLACALVFELVRSNTIHNHRFDIHTDYDLIDKVIFYKVWVNKSNN